MQTLVDYFLQHHEIIFCVIATLWFFRTIWKITDHSNNDNYPY